MAHPTGDHITQPTTFCADIVDCIIDCFGDERPNLNRKMLSTCSLVCRGWLRHSQMRLLQTIILNGQERFKLFTSTLPTLSPRAQGLIRELIISSPETPDPMDPIVLSEAHLSVFLNLLPNLVSLSLCRVMLASDIVQPQTTVSRRLLLALFNVTNDAFSWHPMREIIGLISHFSGVDDLYIAVDPLCAERRPPRDLRTVEAIRADMSWAADVPKFVSPSRLRIGGPPTTHLHIMQLLRMANEQQALKVVRLSALDPDILLELELLLRRSPESVEKLSLTFCSDVEMLSQFPRLAGFASELIRLDTLEWTLDASMLINLRTIELCHCLHALNHHLEALSRHRWTQLLCFVERFSVTPVQSVVLDLEITPWNPSNSNIMRALEEQDWLRLAASLQRFKSLRSVHVKLRCWSALAQDSRDEQRKVAIEYLELMAKGLARLKAEGKAVFDWMYYVEEKGAFHPREFRLP